MPWGTVQRDPDVAGRLKVAFSQYSVSLAEIIFPASDLSEQISTAAPRRPAPAT